MGVRGVGVLKRGKEGGGEGRSWGGGSDRGRGDG